jgi:hypothetical protein
MSVHPFADSATLYRRLGLSPIPVDPQTKMPLVSIRNWTHPPSERTIAQWVQRHSASGIALELSTSGLTVIDVDQPGEKALNKAVDRFGQPGAISRTRSGGFHLFFRANGERQRIRLDGLPIDLKGGSSRGYAIVPNTDRYQWLVGGPDAIAAKSELPKLEGLQERPGALTSAPIPQGQRNDTLFRHLLGIASGLTASDPEEIERTLFEAGLRFTATGHFPPLPEAEVKKTARQVARYVASDSLIAPGQPCIVIGADARAALEHDPQSFLVYAVLRENHALRDSFAMPYEWLQRRFRVGRQRAIVLRKCLIDAGLVEVIHAGGRGPGDVTLFKLVPVLRVSREDHNSTNTPPPAYSRMRQFPTGSGLRCGKRDSTAGQR